MNIDWRTVAVLVAFGLCGAVLGAWLYHWAYVSVSCICGEGGSW